MFLTRVLSAALCAAMLSSPAGADEFFATDGFKLFEVDEVTGVATELGPITGSPVFGFERIDRAPDGTLYATASNQPLSGYQIFRIDELTLTATLVAAIPSLSPGDVGFAIDPDGKRAWVAGHAAPQIIAIDEVDLQNATVVPRGQFAGEAWGLAFDTAGELYTTRVGQTWLDLMRIDKQDAAISTWIGPIVNVDFTQGIDMTSDLGDGPMVFSRATDKLYRVDTKTAIAHEIATIDVSEIDAVTGEGPCPGKAAPFGVGCAGTGGFVPELTATGCPIEGEPLRLELTNGLGGAPAVFVFGLSQGSTPVGAGCALQVSNVLPIVEVIPLAGQGPGNGEVTLFDAAMPANLSGLKLTMQAWVVDPANAIGGAGTNGLELQVP